jgi:hypothetical protein
VTGATAVWVLLALWAGCSMAGGALLALLARRIHPSLSFRRLWLFYTAILGFTGAVVMVLIWH